MKSLSCEDINGLKIKIGRMEVENVQLTNEATHLHAYVDELRDEVAPLQEDNNLLFE